MRKLRDGFGLRLTAAGAGKGLGAGLGLGGGLRHFTIIPCVAERVHVSIHIAIAAGAGVGRVTLGRAGRGSHHILVAVLMRKLRDGFGLRLTAAGAGEGLGAGLGFRRLLRHFAVVPCVAERVRVSIHIAITAGAGVRRVALFGAGRRGDDSLVAVDGLRLRLAAARAGEGLHAVLSFGGGLRHFAFVPAMAESRNLMGKGLAAIRFGTGARLRASLGAGGLFFSCPFTEVMNGCIFGDGFIFAFNRHFLPCIFRAKKVNIFNVVTIIECNIADLRNGARNYNALQTLTGDKCKALDSGNAIRNGNALEAFASGKCTAANSRHAIRDGNALEAFTSGEGTAFNIRHAIRDHNGFQFRTVLKSTATDARQTVWQ